MTPDAHHLAFAGETLVAAGTLPEVAKALRSRLDHGETATISVFDAATAATVELDLRGSPEEVAARATARSATPTPSPEEKTGPGRPKLGVVSREVTLLPRHWDWLAGQPGGASVTLRKLVEAARKDLHGSQQIRRTQDITYRFMHAMAGNLPGFEEATRALYAWDLARFEEMIESWPADVREQTLGFVRRGPAPDATRV
ncbi:MAG: DUF2239 family protein [Candidatus Bipolaricaulota bacterium]